MSKHFKRSAIVWRPADRGTGRICRWRGDWGFIEGEDPYDGRDVFVHYRMVPDEADRQLLKFGVRFSYELEPGCDTPRAANVQVIC